MAAIRTLSSFLASSSNSCSTSYVAITTTSSFSSALRGIATLAYETLRAEPREGSGSRVARKERAMGRTPVAFADARGGWHNRTFTVDSNELQRLFVRVGGREGLCSTTISLQITQKTDSPSPRSSSPEEEEEEVLVLPRGVYINALTDEVEALRLYECVPGTTMRVKVPVRVTGTELCPGLKRGGILNLVQRTLEMRCPSTSIPRSIEVDLSSLQMNQTVKYRNLVIPDKCELIIKDPARTVAKIVVAK